MQIFGQKFLTISSGLQFYKNCSYIFEPKNREMIEKSSNALLNFSQLKYKYLGKNSYKYHKGIVRKMKLKSGHL